MPPLDTAIGIWNCPDTDDIVRESIRDYLDYRVRLLQYRLATLRRTPKSCREPVHQQIVDDCIFAIAVLRDAMP